MNQVEELQEWYLAQCDEEWEHVYGITIRTLDNPGWTLDIDLKGTPLESTIFPEHSYGVDSDAVDSDDDWISCKRDGGKFIGRSGPRKLNEMIEVFLTWAKANA